MRRRILLVEDDANDVELLRRCFRPFGHAMALDVVFNGQEAIAFMTAPAGERPKPDVILTDINMPVLDGFGFLDWLKKQSPHRRTPVVMLTSSVVERDKARAYDLGASAYLVKPPEYDGLQAAVEAVVKFWRMNQTPPIYLDR